MVWRSNQIWISFDRELFDLLFDDFEIDDVIIRCIKIKAQITER